MFLPSEEIVTDGCLYRCAKSGKAFTVLTTAMDSDSSELFVVFQSEDGQFRVTPLVSFTAKIRFEGAWVPRFSKLTKGEKKMSKKETSPADNLISALEQYIRSIVGETEKPTKAKKEDDKTVEVQEDLTEEAIKVFVEALEEIGRGRVQKIMKKFAEDPEKPPKKIEDIPKKNLAKLIKKMKAKIKEAQEEE